MHAKTKRIWHRDIDSEVCQCCSQPFTFSRRRHHCRMCGHLVCNVCSKRRLSRGKYPRLLKKPGGWSDEERVCKGCMSKVSLQKNVQCILGKFASQHDVTILGQNRDDDAAEFFLLNTLSRLIDPPIIDPPSNIAKQYNVFLTGFTRSRIFQYNKEGKTQSFLRDEYLHKVKREINEGMSRACHYNHNDMSQIICGYMVKEDDKIDATLKVIMDMCQENDVSVHLYDDIDLYDDIETKHFISSLSQKEKNILSRIKDKEQRQQVVEHMRKLRNNNLLSDFVLRTLEKRPVNRRKVILVVDMARLMMTATLKESLRNCLASGTIHGPLLDTKIPSYKIGSVLCFQQNQDIEKNWKYPRTWPYRLQDYKGVVKQYVEIDYKLVSEIMNHHESRSRDLQIVDLDAEYFFLRDPNTEWMLPR